MNKTMLILSLILSYGIYSDEPLNRGTTDGAFTTLTDFGVKSDNIKRIDVPGSFELVFGSKKMIQSNVDVVIAIGCVIKGETEHFDYICKSVSSGIVDLNIKDPDYFPVLVANKILGGGPENRLEQQIREVKGYTYVARSSIGSSKYTKSRFRAFTQTRFQVTDSAVVELLNEIKKIRTLNVTSKELSDVKAKYVGNFVLATESPSTIANYALNIKTQELDKDFYKNYLKNILNTKSL